MADIQENAGIDQCEAKELRDPWIHRSSQMSCRTCMWYVMKERTGPILKEVGRCRKHAPTMTGYPVVFSTDWCGDHKIDENKI